MGIVGKRLGPDFGDVLRRHVLISWRTKFTAELAEDAEIQGITPGYSRRAQRPRRWISSGLSGERRSAPTRLRGLRIHKDKSLLHQRLLIVERHAVQVDERLRVDEYADVGELKNPVAFPWLRIEPDVVTQPGTPAALHAQAQPALLGRDAFLHHRAADLSDRLLGDLDPFSAGRR